MSAIGVPELVVIPFLAIVVAWPAGRICRRIGWSPWLGVLAVVPLANLFLLWYVAFSEWPHERLA